VQDPQGYELRCLWATHGPYSLLLGYSDERTDGTGAQEHFTSRPQYIYTGNT